MRYATYFCLIWNKRFRIAEKEQINVLSKSIDRRYSSYATLDIFLEVPIKSL